MGELAVDDFVGEPAEEEDGVDDEDGEEFDVEEPEGDDEGGVGEEAEGDEGGSGGLALEVFGVVSIGGDGSTFSGEAGWILAARVWFGVYNFARIETKQVS